MSWYQAYTTDEEINLELENKIPEFLYVRKSDLTLYLNKKSDWCKPSQDILRAPFLIGSVQALTRMTMEFRYSANFKHSPSDRSKLNIHTPEHC